MSAIIEPRSASWRLESWGRVTFAVNAEDRNLMITHEYPRRPNAE